MGRASSTSKLEAAEGVSRGGPALDPEVVKQLLSRRPDGDALMAVTPREREARSSILGKLEAPPDGATHRRVLAVVAFLRRAAPAGPQAG